MATYFESGSVLTAAQMQEVVQAGALSGTDLAHSLQAGSDSFTITAGAADNGTVTFTDAYDSAPIVIVTIDAGSSAGTYNGLRAHIHTVTTTSFQWRVSVADGSTPTVSGALAFIAIGEVTA